MPSPRTTTPADHPIRTAVKQDGIVEGLRQAILDHTYPPGSRLPTRHELRRSFDAASLTVQRALDRLIADGFVTTRGRHGSFVVDHPPSTCHFGLVFPLPPTTWIRFWSTLTEVAQGMDRGGRRRFSIYHGLDGHTDHEDYRRLERDLRNRRLAGIVFAINPFALVGSPILAADGVPRIAVMDRPEHAGVAAVELDRSAFITRALDHFRSRRRGRVAVLTVPGLEGTFRTQALDALAARRQVCRPHWWHVLHQSTAVGANALTQLLFHRGQQERPDALLITDDNLVDHAVAGLVAARVRVPEDVEVVAHCNFPCATHCALPVRRLGFDAQELLTTCLDHCDRRLRGGASDADVVLIPPRFEDERPASSDAP